MTARQLVSIGLSVTFCSALNPTILATQNHDKHDAPVGLVKAVRQATEDFRNVRKAIDAGYESTGSCVTGPEKGAMGIHYANGTLIGDGLIDAKAPELLIYEQKDGRLRLVGVEFLVLADAWNASHPNGEPPVLMGQHFHFVGSPNRYRLPAFYELHVWAWRDNPSGDFVDWNPDVSCSEFNPGGASN
jgi:hypothetical protein